MQPFRTYIAVVGLAVIAVVGRALLEPLLGNQLRYLGVFAIVAFVAAVAGRGPALAAVLVGTVATPFLVPGTDGGPTAAEVVPAASFALSSVLVVAAIAWVQSARTAAERTSAALRAVAEERDAALAGQVEEHRLAQHRARIVGAMQRLSLAVLQARSTTEVAEEILDVAGGLLGAESATIAEVVDGAPALRIVAVRGEASGAPRPGDLVPFDAELPAATAARTAERVLLPALAEPAAATPAGRPAGDDRGAVAAIPVLLDGRVMGVVTFGMPAGAAIEAEDLAFMETTARKLAQALDRLRLDAARRRAADAERQRVDELRAVIDTIDDGLAVFSRGKIVLRNSAFERLAPGPVHDVEDVARAFGLAPDDLRPPASREIPLDGDGGTARWMEVAVLPVASTVARDGSLVMIRDATALRAAVAVRDAFVGMLSHELRTPVTVILGSAKLLERRFVPGDPNLELARDIVLESERMNRLIDDLLVLSASGSEVPMRPEPVLVHHLLASVVAREALRFPDADIRLQATPSLPPGAGDPTLLEQVVRNLVGNAAKYAGPRPTVVVAAREVAGAIEVSVRDDGPGVPAQDHEAIFGIFFRSRATARRTGGAGVGLYVCRRLVEAMGGRIWLESMPGDGACFSFTVPLYAAPDGQPAVALGSGAEEG